MHSDRSYHLWKRPLCWHTEHEWVDDGFMDNGQECARCGAFDSTPGSLTDDPAFVFLAGLFVGVSVAGVAAIVVML